MIETMQILPGAELRCFRDSRFRQGCLSIQFLRRMDAAEASMNALIPNVLLRGTRRCPDMRSITMALDDLYGAAVSPLVRSVGDYQTTGLYCIFVDQRFAMPGDRILEPLLDFVRELLLDYPVREGGFLPSFTEGEKRNLISSIEADLNDKAVYSIGRLLKSMCRGDPFGVPRMGDMESTAAVTPAALLAHWQKLLLESPVQIIYVGSEPPERIAELVRPLLDIPGRAPAALPAQSGLLPSEPAELTETMEVAQARLCMGFTSPFTIRTPENAANQLLNVIYGGGMTSKLFTNVREKKSLCYSISSGLYSSKGILTVSAGIDTDCRQAVQEEILHQLELCRRAEITEEELTAAREAMISGLRAAHDSPGSIEGYYATAALSGLERTPEAYIDILRAVTRDQIAAAAANMKLHSVFFLKGAGHDD